MRPFVGCILILVRDKFPTLAAAPGTATQSSIAPHGAVTIQEPWPCRGQVLGMVLFLFAIRSEHFSHWVFSAGARVALQVRSAAGAKVLYPAGPTAFRLHRSSDQGPRSRISAASPTHYGWRRRCTLRQDSARPDRRCLLCFFSVFSLRKYLSLTIESKEREVRRGASPQVIILFRVEH